MTGAGCGAPSAAAPCSSRLGASLAPVVNTRQADVSQPSASSLQAPRSVSHLLVRLTCTQKLQ